MMETHLPFDNVIFRYQRPDKTTVWVSGNGRPLYDANGEISGYIGSVTDITEHKLLEELLTASESRFRTLIDFAPVGIVETDTNGMVILGNERWSMLSGISQDRAFIGDGTETVHADDLQMVQAANQKMQEGLTPIDNLEYRFRHPDGKVVWVSDSSRPIFDLNGDVTGSICTMTDITEPKRLEEALRQNEERLRNITDNLEDLVAQSDGEGQLVFVSRSYQTVLGYDPQLLIGKSAMEFIHPDDLPLMIQAMQTAVESGTQQVTFEGRMRHADGHYIHVESVGKIFIDIGSVFSGGVFITRDVSERVRLQNLVLETEKLQTALDKELELNNLKTRMMNRIAHEFRTPLTVIQATTETLTYYLDRLNADQRKAKEASIKGQIQRLTDMLDEIGQVIKTDFTPEHVHRVTTDLGLLCRQIVTQIEQEMNQPGQFELDLPERTEVLVDPQVLKNAFLQVMHNAARFSDVSAHVNVKLSCCENGVTLRVTDTGIGIPPKEQPRIFEPFFRGSNIGESSGLGVGLTMTRAAIEAHGGTITVNSELGKGTSITIWIPVS
jgi:PAS domain S-box-containing protein